VTVLTPKIALVTILVVGGVWAFARARDRIGSGLAMTVIDVAEAVLWGYAVYLLVAIPFNLDRLTEWRPFFGLLRFERPMTGMQVWGLLAGALTALFRCFERTGLISGRPPDEHIRGRSPLETHAFSNLKPRRRWSMLDALERLLERLSGKK